MYEAFPHLYKSTLLLHEACLAPLLVPGSHQEVATCGRHIVLVTRLSLSSLPLPLHLPPSPYTVAMKTMVWGTAGLQTIS